MINDRSESQGVRRKGSKRWRDGLYPFQTVNAEKREGKRKGKKTSRRVEACES